MRALGWTGPEPGGRHPFMLKDGKPIPIPNPHGNDLDWTLVKRIIKQAGIDVKTWDRLG